MQRYQVKKGDSAYSIARAMTGDGTRSRDLAAANPAKKKKVVHGVVTFDKLTVGEWLNVPRSWQPGRVGMGKKMGDAAGFPAGCGPEGCGGGCGGKCGGCGGKGNGVSGPPRGVGMGAAYTPEAGNMVVDPTAADAACTGSFTRPQSWPPVMTQEAVKWGQQSSNGDIFIFCGVDKNLYQITATGGGAAGLQVCTQLDPSFGCQPGYSKDASGNCVPTPTGGCPSGQHLDPSGNCVPDPGVTTTGGGIQRVGAWWSTLSTGWKVGVGIGAVGVAGGLLYWATRPPHMGPRPIAQIAGGARRP
jgi:hypothetical protein